MNEWQTLQTFAFAAQKLEWADGTTDHVFHYPSVRVSGGLTAERFSELQRPMLLLYPGTFQADPEIHGFGRATINARLTTWAEDQLGEVPLIGGNRSAGQGASAGRGLLEIEAVLHDALEHLNHEHGFHLTGGFRGAPEASYEAGAYYVTRLGSFEVDATLAPYYTPPICLTATAAGGGAVTLAWRIPPERFDFAAATAWRAARGTMVLRRAAGSTAPSSATGGTGVTLAGAFSTGVTDTPGVGTWSYALFAGYDEVGGGSPDRYSSQETGTTRTVVAT